MKRFYFLGFFLVMIVWSLLSYSGLVSRFFLPTPASVLAAIGSLVLMKGFLSDIGISFFRVLTGFILSIMAAIPLGMVIAVNKKAEAMAGPVVLLRYIPPSALIPLAILWFGIGEMEKIFIVFLSIFPYFVLLVSDIVSHTPQEYIDAAKKLGASRLDVVKRVLLPFNMPKIYQSIRFMFAVGWAYIIMVELVGSNSGLGHFILRSQRFMHTPELFAGILIIGLIGILVDMVFSHLYRPLFPWVKQIG